MAVTGEGSHALNQMYSGWQTRYSTMAIYHVPTWHGYVVVMVSESETYMQCIRDGRMHWRAIDRPYATNTGITRAVNRWMWELDRLPPASPP